MKYLKCWEGKAINLEFCFIENCPLRVKERGLSQKSKTSVASRLDLEEMLKKALQQEGSSET